jgi:dTDP-4-amino-4,6-dideoxygalactose transaminase
VERKITPRTSAIMVVHWPGCPADMDAILDIAARHSLRVVEDNCISQGATHRGRMAGSIGDAAAISFQHGKSTSAGEGGVFMTNDTEVYQRAATLGHYERLRNLPNPKWRAMTGFSFGEKYRMATLSAAIGCVQMKYWRERLDVRHANTDELGAAVAAIEGFSAPDFPDYFPSPYQSGRIKFDPAKLGGISRTRLLEVLQAEGAQVSSPAQKDTLTPHANGLTHMLHKHPVFQGNEYGTGDVLWETLGPNVTKIEYKNVVLPVTEDPEIPYDSIRVPSFTRPAAELIDQYVAAFEKVAASAGILSGALAEAR